MLDRMPVADEETVRNRRARFRNDDVRWELDAVRSTCVCVCREEESSMCKSDREVKHNFL